MKRGEERGKGGSEKRRRREDVRRGEETGKEGSERRGGEGERGSEKKGREKVRRDRNGKSG